jgi:hypothetical protein
VSAPTVARRFQPGARLAYLGLALGAMALGFFVHFHAYWLGDAGRDFAGDLIWAMMMSWLIAVPAPRLGIVARSAIALGISYAVELSQLVSLPWLDAARQTFLGHVALGTGFNPRDFLAYLAGVVLAPLVERLLLPGVSERR